MAWPPTYTPAKDFSEDESNNLGGRSTVDTAGLDSEHDSIKATLDSVIANIKAIIRSDGKQQDGFTELHALASDVLALINSGVSYQGSWATATAYTAGQSVLESSTLYLCLAAHTSGVFATDLASNNWIRLTYDDIETNVSTLTTSLNSHIANTSNPHSVTKSQVGLSNVDDVKQLPIAGGTLTGRLTYKKGASIASAATCDISGATGNVIHITGTTGISAFTMTSGQLQEIIFDAVLALTHHTTNNKLLSGANITTAVGDRALYFYDGTTVRMLSYSKADGTPVVAGSSGKILQVKQAIQETGTSTSSSTYSDIISIPITPASTSNKIAIIVSGNASINGTSLAMGAGMKVLRDSTAILTKDYSMYRQPTETGFVNQARTYILLDSPSTASEVTYKLQMNSSDNSTTHIVGADATMIIMEVEE